MQGSELPQKRIGGYLKQRRERLNESLAEVSGAVEIDIQDLSDIEAGSVLPSEDILVLLLSHLEVDETAARKVLKLAGYDVVTSEETGAEEQLKQQIYMLSPLQQVNYVDDFEVKRTKNGVVVTYFQPGLGDGSMPIARVGMSLDDVKELIAKLEQAQKGRPAKTQAKLLPAKTKTHNKSRNK